MGGFPAGPLVIALLALSSAWMLVRRERENTRQARLAQRLGIEL